MNTIKSFALLISFACYLTACSKASEDQLREQNAVVCDTSNVQYQSGVLPIISANCYSCHSGDEAEAGINLDGYSNLKIQADNGALKGAVTHAPGYVPMPFDQPKLSDCDINRITAWVNAGAPNN